MKRIISLVLCAVMIVLSVSCTNLKSSDKESATVMQICGYDVPYEMLRYAVMNVLDAHIAAGGREITEELMATEEGQALNDELMEKAKDRLGVIYSVFALGEKYGIGRDEAAICALVDANLEEQRAGYGSDREYKKALEESNMTMAVSRVMLEFDVIYTEIYEAMLSEGDIETDPGRLEEIFMSDEFIRVKELLFSTERHTLEECRTLCENALAEIKGGADFSEYIQEHGESLFMFSNDDGYYICRGIWDKVLEDAVFELEIGEISDVLVTEDGARLFMRAEKSREFIEERFDELTETYTEGVFRQIVEAQVDEVQITEGENFGSYTVLSISTEDK